MDKRTVLRKSWLALCFSLILFTQSTNAFARPGTGGPDGPRRGPENIELRQERYRYHDGRFYRPIFFGLFEILVDVPPVGAIVTVLPAGYRTIIIGGVSYYYYDNIYYTVCPSGYIVVSAPVVSTGAVVVSPAVSVTQPQKISGETVIINVPNSNGSYTAVTLVKQKDGYTGPQGEYYPGHPTVEQLRVLYGK
ncbi:MAG: DUF6515 family protein [Candidatus Omnitrophota bacterium]